MPENTLPSISLHSRVVLRPLSTQLENGVAIVGYADQFLELPPEGLKFIDWLNSGLTVAEARDRFEAAFNPFPDDEVQAVMDTFLESDFIAEVDGRAIAPRRAPLPAETEWIPRRWARAIFSTPALLAWLAFCLPAVALWVATPALWPRRSDYFWTGYYFLVVLVGMLLWFVRMALHETAHWLAARAKGIAATVTWTQRVGFFPMSQTVMHNIWAVPRRARYLPLAAGMLNDVFWMSAALYALYLAHAGFWAMPAWVAGLLKFHLLTATMALAAQFWLFSKMDGYFLLSALLGQRNLQGDTYAWLKSRLKRRPFDPPASGMKFIYLYALVSLVWGGLFVGQFLLVDLPIKLQLLWVSLLKVAGGTAQSPLELADGVAVITSQGIYWGLLLYAYLRDTLPNWRRGTL